MSQRGCLTWELPTVHQKGYYPTSNMPFVPEDANILTGVCFRQSSEIRFLQMALPSCLEFHVTKTKWDFPYARMDPYLRII